MKHKSLGKMQCPVSRSLERVGEWWSMLIIRDALHGLTRFDQFEESLGIAPNMLTRRLAALVKAGVLEKRSYSEGASVLLVHAKTGAPADPVMVDRRTGRPLTLPEYVVAPGPAAVEGTRRKLESSAWGLARAIDRPLSPFERHRVRKPRNRS